MNFYFRYFLSSFVTWTFLSTFTFTIAQTNDDADVDDGYEPITIVKQMHNVLHLDSSGAKTENDFGTNQEYAESIIAIPVIVGSLALACVVIFLILLVSRCCCECARCGPDGNNDVNFKRKISLVFIINCILVLAALLLSLIGNSYIDQGVDDTVDSIDFVETTFTDLTTYGNDLLSSGQNISSKTDAAVTSGCVIAAELYPYLDEYNTAVTDYLGFVEDIPDKANDAGEMVSDIGRDKKNQVLWVFFAVIIILLIFFVIGNLIRSKIMLQGSMTFSLPIVIILIVLCTIVFVLLMGMADFCMDPTGNVEDASNAEGSTLETIQYYTTCVGTNPMQDSLDDATQAVLDMSENVETYGTLVCPGNPYLEAMNYDFLAMQRSIQLISNTTDCEPVVEQWQTLAYDGICDHFYTGLYTIWLCIYLTAILLFTLSIFASIYYQYFNLNEILNTNMDRVSKSEDL